MKLNLLDKNIQQNADIDMCHSESIIMKFQVFKKFNSLPSKHTNVIHSSSEQPTQNVIKDASKNAPWDTTHRKPYSIT